MSTSARWCFTLNNPGDYRPVWNDVQMDYMVYQLERGANGTEHLQGYVRFKARKRMNTVKNLLCNDGVHLETAKGNEKQNKEYCTKEETRVDGPWEFGTYDENAGKQGNRSDLDEVANALKEGKSLRQIADMYTCQYIKYARGIEATNTRLSVAPPPMRNVKVLLLFGPTATGKTHRIMHACPDIYCVEPGRGPWDMYNSETHILFDEFEPESWPITTMNRILDKWRFQLNCRYQNKYAAWTHVCILTNSRPEDLYRHHVTSQPHYEAFQRRLTNSIEVLSQDQNIEEQINEWKN